MPNRKNILITGIDSGLEEALTREYLAITTLTKYPNL